MRNYTRMMAAGLMVLAIATVGCKKDEDEPYTHSNPYACAVHTPWW